MLRLLDGATKFVVTPQSPAQRLEFGTTLFLTTLTSGMPINAIETALLGGGGLFGNSMVFPALLFHAECVVLIEKATSPRFPEIDLRGRFDFGFVQGIRESDIHLDYWGRFPEHGRTVVHIGMPRTFEVDTDPATAPFTRIPGARFAIRNITQAAGKFNSLLITADFDDHPMYTFRHTLTHANNGTQQFIRSVAFRREFRTIFCFREKSTGDFTPVAATEWDIRYDQVVTYSSGGTVRNITDRASGHTFPRRGSPSEIGSDDRRILQFAKAGAPLMTQAILGQRLAPAAPGRTLTTEDRNGDFVEGFFS